jgi:predicted DNA-binding transcriptional regulator AlpA
MATTTMAPELVDADALAAMLNLSIHTIRDWRKQGRGPQPIKLTPGRQGRIRFQLDEVRRWQADPVAYEARRRRSHRGPRR